MKFISVAIALTIGNYVYQAIAGHNWDTAAEYSFLQAVAIGAMWLNGAR